MAKRKIVKSKVVKKKAAKKELAKNKRALAGKDKAEGSDILGTITVNGKNVNIERWHIRGISIPPACIAGSIALSEKISEALTQKFEAIKVALRSDSKSLQDEAIDTMLGDLITGAYQDKLVIYTRVPSGHSKNSIEALKELQGARQAADTHLLNIIKAVRDIKRPSVNVMIKQADQVNVGEQINQGDKQVNIAQNQQSV
ncbi:MAG: hypothetical protein ACYSSO_11810 [Planctomycetota bacterium]|jgi:hypothetical protein